MNPADLPDAPTWTHVLDAARKGSGDLGGIDDAIAKQWRTRVDPVNAEGLARRLSWAGIDEDVALRTVSGAPPSPPFEEWRVHLAGLIDRLGGPMVDDAEVVAWCGGGGLGVPFAHALMPLARAAVDTATPSGGADPFVNWSEPALRATRLMVLARVSGAVERALFEHFQATSVGYRDYCAGLIADQFGRFFSVYPVAGRLMSTEARNAATAAVEFAARLGGDRSLLHEALGTSMTAPVTSVRWGLSDSHRGGRQVAIVDIDGTRVVYKPKDMRLDAAFQRQLGGALAWIGLRSLTVVCCEDHAPYGWMEHLAWQPAQGQAELDAFWRNAGALLAVLHVVGGSDGHHENLVAHGDQWVLVDAETVLESTIDSVREKEAPLDWSVLRMLVLPNARWYEGRGLADLSALGASQGQEEHVRRFGWIDVNTDGMRWGSVSRSRAPITSSPRASSVPVDAEAMVQGFERAFRHLMTATALDELDEALASLAGLPRRLVFRATQVYVAIQRNASSPTALASCVQRGLVLEQLARTYVMNEQRPDWWPLLHAELEAMEQGDVPFFTHLVGEQHFEVDGQRVPVTDGLALARQRLAHLSEEDLALQVRLIRASVVTRGAHLPDRPIARRGNGEASPEKAAASIASRLVRDALVGETDVSWVAPLLMPDLAHFTLGMSASWFDGSLGTATALRAIANRTTDESLRAHAVALCDRVISSVVRATVEASGEPVRRPVLGLQGLGGLLRALDAWQLLGAIPPADAEFVRGWWLSRITVDHVRAAPRLDAVTGVIGLLRPMAKHVSPATAPVLAAAARRVAEAPMDQLMHPNEAVVGLLDAGRALSDGNLIAAALRIMSDEAGHRDPHDASWCTGSSGALRARLHVLAMYAEHSDASRWTAEVENLVAHVVRAPSVDDVSVYSGLAGRVVALHHAGRVLLRDDIAASATDLASRMSGRPDSVSPLSPSLMTGFAGVAWVMALGADTPWFDLL